MRTLHAFMIGAPMHGVSEEGQTCGTAQKRTLLQSRRSNWVRQGCRYQDQREHPPAPQHDLPVLLDALENG